MLTVLKSGLTHFIPSSIASSISEGSFCVFCRILLLLKSRPGDISITKASLAEQTSEAQNRLNSKKNSDKISGD